MGFVERESGRQKETIRVGPIMLLRIEVFRQRRLALHAWGRMLGRTSRTCARGPATKEKSVTLDGQLPTGDNFAARGGEGADD